MQQLTPEIAERVQNRLRKQMRCMPFGVSPKVISGLIEDIVEDEIERSNQRLAEEFFRHANADRPIHASHLA